MCSREMPKYQCHKIVHALEIKSIDGTTITPADEGYAPFSVESAWIERHKPEAGGFYVVYGDGYVSYSPRAAFLEGYARIS